MSVYAGDLFASGDVTFPQVISNSLVTEYKSCPLKAFYKHILRIRPKQANVHLNSGKAYADALDKFRQIYYDPDRTTDVPQSEHFDRAVIEATKVLTIAYGDFEPLEKNQNKTWERVFGAMCYYLSVWHPEQDVLKPTIMNGKPATEFSFAEPLHEEFCRHPDTDEPLLYTGRFDSIMEMRSPLNLFAYDDKTTSQLGASWADSWTLQSQFMGYAWGAQRYNLNLQGTIIRGVSILKNSYGHSQAIVYHPKWVIERWYTSTVYAVQQMINDYKAGYWNAALNQACSNYGGCELKMLCEAPDPSVWIEPYFEKNLWNPLTGEDDPS